MSGRIRLVLTVALLIAVAAVAGVTTWTLTGHGGPAAQPASAGQTRWTVDDAKQFKDFPLYWLGDSFQGLPLTRIIRYRYEPSSPEELAIQERFSVNLGEDSVTFIYGSCTPGPEDDTGCPVPLSVSIEPYCTRPPELLASGARRGPPQAVRGVQAQGLGNGGLFLWSRGVMISIWATGDSVAVAAAEVLDAVGPGPRSGEPLPPPDAAGCP